MTLGELEWGPADRTRNRPSSAARIPVDDKVDIGERTVEQRIAHHTPHEPELVVDARGSNATGQIVQAIERSVL